MNNADKLRSLEKHLLETFHAGLLNESDCNSTFVAITKAYRHEQSKARMMDFAQARSEGMEPNVAVPGEQHFQTAMPKPVAASFASILGEEEDDEDAEDFDDEDDEEEECDEEESDSRAQRPITITNCSFIAGLNKDEAKVLRILARAASDNAKALCAIAGRLAAPQPSIFIGNR